MKRVNDEMEGYYLYNVIPPLIEFVDDLTNWYIRRSRRRFWGRDGEVDDDAMSAFATLYRNATIYLMFVLPVQARWFIWLEILILPGYNDGEENLKALVEAVKKIRPAMRRSRRFLEKPTWPPFRSAGKSTRLSCVSRSSTI